MLFIENNNVAISLLSSYNLYVDSTTKTIIGDEAKIVTHIESNQEFYAIKTKKFKFSPKKQGSIKDYYLSKRQKSKWERIIEYPGNKSFMWPIDVVSFLQTNECYMIYKFVPQSHFDSIATLSKDSSFLGFENPRIRKIVMNFIDAYISINNNFLYFGLDDDDIFVNASDDSLLLPVYDSILSDADLNFGFLMKDYFSEVIDPYAFENRKISPISIEEDIYQFDKKSEMFAFSSIIFRLLIGLYPYEGPYLTGYANNLFTEENMEWILKYVNNPVFIFDEEDKSNSITDYNANEVHVKRWEKLPSELQIMFSQTFKEENVMRNNQNYKPYGIHDWEKAMKSFFENIH